MRAVQQKCNQNLSSQYFMAYYRKDQLSIKSRQLLADYLADLILITDSIESFRVALASTPQFSGIGLFRYLDQNQKGLLVPSDFAILVKDEGKKVLHYAFSWFDVSKVGQVTRSQFLQFLYPRRHPELRQVITDRMVAQHDPMQDQATLPAQLQLLQELVLEIMQRQIRVIPRRRMLMDQEDYTIKAIMNCLDVEARGWITTGDVYKFLRNFDVDVNPSQVCEMLGIYDHDLNGKIQMKQLQILIEGLERSGGVYRNIVRNSDRSASSKLKRSRCTCYKNVRQESAQKRRTSNIMNQKSHTFTSKKKSARQQNQNQNLLKSQKYKQRIAHKLFEGRSNLKQKSSNLAKNLQQNVVYNKSRTNKRQKEKQPQRSKQVYEVTNLHELKTKFEALEKQTEFMDQELIKIDEQMKVQTQLEMEKSLEHVHIVNKQMQMLELERLRKQQLQLQAVAQKERKLRLKQQEQARILEMQRRMKLQLEIQRQRSRQKQIANGQRLHEMQLQSMRIRQLEQEKVQRAQRIRVAQVEQQRLRSIERQRRAQIQTSILERQLRFVHDTAQSQIDWQAQQRLRILHQQDFRQRSLREGKSKKQTEYFWRYNNYCHNLASIGDPLGIKQHLVETDKYLIKSKQIRDQIKKDRSKSLNRYSYQNSSARKSKINTEKVEIEKTPEARRDLISNIDKRTEQTKLVWS